MSRARDLGFLGPGPLRPQIEHAEGFAGVWGSERPGRAPAALADLGSGGGLPGLVLAGWWPDCRLLLVESMSRRAEFLRRAVAELELPRASVAESRAEEVGRAPGTRESFDLVTARGFGPPAVTAECGAALLGPGGLLVVSEPPEGAGERWPAEGLVELGLGAARPVSVGDRRYVAIPKAAPCPNRYPRRVGVPAKRPLF